MASYKFGLHSSSKCHFPDEPPFDLAFYQERVRVRVIKEVPLLRQSDNITLFLKKKIFSSAAAVQLRCCLNGSGCKSGAAAVRLANSASRTMRSAVFSPEYHLCLLWYEQHLNSPSRPRGGSSIGEWHRCCTKH